MLQDRVLIVEDEASLRYVLSSVLGGLGCTVTCAGSAEEALPLLKGEPFALAMLDIILPGMTGLDLLGIIRERSPDTEVIIMTSHASLDTAIDAIRKGAYDYLHKPFEIDELSATATRALEKRRLIESNRELHQTTERQNRELTAAVRRLASLNTAGIGFSGRASVQAVLDLFLDIIQDELDVARASVMMREDGEEQLRVVAARGLDLGIAREARVPPGAGVAGRVFETGRTIRVEEAGPDLRESARPDLGSSYLSAPIVLSAPIKSLDRVIGVVNLTNRQSGRPFDQADADYLAGLCGQLAVSIERAQQTDRLHETIEVLQAAQERLLASERLNALGEMAAGVAHDFNNVLNGILGRTQLMRTSLGQGDVEPTAFGDSLDLIETLARQAADAVRRIQESTRIRKVRSMDAVDVNAAVRLAIELLRPRLNGSDGARHGPIEVRLELDDVPPTTGNALELVQALSNLIFNAVDAMPDGGVLVFRTQAAGGWIHLAVSDTGVGLTAETKAHLFTPFHTTKPEGNGLGLSVVYGIVTRMGGAIEADGAPRAGATFTLKLPARAADVHVPEPETNDPLAAPRAAHILVVDDEYYNREFYVECLALHGHTVVAAASGEEALAAFDRDLPDLLLTDLTMPGMDGWEVASAAKRRAPAVPVIMLSGCGAQLAEERARQAGVDLMLSKPIGIDELLEAVQGTLRAASEPKCA